MTQLKSLPQDTAFHEEGRSCRGEAVMWGNGLEVDPQRTVDDKGDDNELEGMRNKCAWYPFGGSNADQGVLRSAGHLCRAQGGRGDPRWGPHVTGLPGSRVL